MRVVLAQSDNDLQQLAPVMCQLRPHFDSESLVRQARQQMEEEGYHLAMVLDDEAVLCVAGFVIQRKLAWGKHLYVDDLVTDVTLVSRAVNNCISTVAYNVLPLIVFISARAW